MKVAILVVTFLALSSASPYLKEHWTSFKAQYGKSYVSEEEEQYRLSVFSDNLKTIERHNLKHKAGLVSYYLKLNKFSDLTTEEYGALLGEFKVPGQQINLKVTGLHYQPPANVTLPQSIDWRDKGAVTNEEMQGLLCRSGWAFSAIGSLEGQLFMKTGELVSLSHQQLVDCSTDFGNRRCEGGSMDNSFEYIKHAGGIMSEDSYPYAGVVCKDFYHPKNLVTSMAAGWGLGLQRDRVNGSCKFQLKEAVNGSAVKSYVDLKKGDVKALESAVATVGPISVGISAGNVGFRHYSGGIFDGKDCEPSKITHAVLLVGYEYGYGGKDYWIVKNSWGKMWGENGYMRLEKKNYENICGIASLASYPVL